MLRSAVPFVHNLFSFVESLTSMITISYLLHDRIILFYFTDIDDPDNVLADQLTEKYLKGAEMGNFTSMTPGFTDVMQNKIKVICSFFLY